MKAVVVLFCAGALAAVVVLTGRNAVSPVSNLFGAARPDADGGKRDSNGSGASLPPRLTPATPDAAMGAGRAVPVSSLVLPLVDRRLTQPEKTAAMAPELREAINRMAPLFDPTRLDGPSTVVPLRVSAGSAFPADIFAERWRLVSDDPNVDAVAASLALGWLERGRGPLGLCEGYAKRRQRPFNVAASTPLSPGECLHLRRRQAPGADNAAPLPIVAAALDVPAFAAPFPGARMSSEAFWLARKQRIEAVEAQLRAQREARRAALAAKP